MSSLTGNIIFKLSFFTSKLFGKQHGFHVQWFDKWNVQLDEALQNLPEMGQYSHELFRLVARNQTLNRKRIALVTDKGIPAAVVALRQRGIFWEPVTQWLLPGSIFPVREDSLMPSLIALGVEVEIAWWRMNASPPNHLWIRANLLPTPTYRMPLSMDFEGYWRKSGQFKDVRSARNRCLGFTFEVNSPGAAEWIIKNSTEKWASSENTYIEDLSDRLIVADYLAKHGQFHSLLLLNGGIPVAGNTFIVHGRDLVSGVVYRNPEYDKFSAGTRIWELSFEWAAKNNYVKLDMGGGFDYKKRWAPQEGERFKFRICPPYLYTIKQALRLGRRLSSNMIRRSNLRDEVLTI